MKRPQSSALAVAFAVYGISGVLVLAFLMPPYLGPDEVSHFMRAEQISEGQIVGGPVTPAAGGGIVDDGIALSFLPFDPVLFDRHARVNIEMYAKAASVEWAGGRSLWQFNMAAYPPFFYLPSIVGVWLGKIMSFSIVETLYLSRVMTGIVSVGIAALAIAMSGAAAAWFFAVLTLPMSLSLYASCSQDGPMLATAAFAASVLLRVRSGCLSGPVPFMVFCICLAFLGMARPPYAWLGLLVLSFPFGRIGSRAVGMIAILSAIGAWSVIAAANGLISLRPDAPVDPLGQLMAVMIDPEAAASVTVNTISTHWRMYLDGFVGILGWLDVFLPKPFYTAAWGVLFVSVALSVTMKDWRVSRLAAPAVIILLCVFSVFVIQYLTWTPIGAVTIDGVQGRYFLPLALLLAVLLPGGRAAYARWQLAGIVILVVFPSVSISVAVSAIVARYYLA